MSNTALPAKPPASDEQAARIAKLQAEAAREQAETQKLHVEIRKLIAEAAEAEAKAAMTEDAAVVARIQRQDRELIAAYEAATDERHRVYTFDAIVGPVSVRQCMTQLTAWARMEPGCPIELRLISPGGSVTEGMALYDFLRSLSTQGHRITTVAYGLAASMAAVLLQAGDERLMARESWLLIHEGSLGTMGSAGEVEDTVDWFKRVRARIAAIFVSRSDLDTRTFDRNWKRRDWFLDSDEALKLRLIDGVR